jgi:hypothetical protein
MEQGNGNDRRAKISNPDFLVVGVKETRIILGIFVWPAVAL